MADSLDANLDEAILKMRSVAFQVCDDFAPDLAAAMQANAAWNDENGPSLTGLNARQSLEAEVGALENGDILIVARSTRQTTHPWRGWDGAPVGAFLELGTIHMHSYPVIWRTLEDMTDQLHGKLTAAFAPDGA